MFWVSGYDDLVPEKKLDHRHLTETESTAQLIPVFVVASVNNIYDYNRHDGVGDCDPQGIVQEIEIWPYEKGDNPESVLENETYKFLRDFCI